MKVIDQLASSLGRRDEGPNIDLSKRLAAQADQGEVNELVQIIVQQKKTLRRDAIKVLASLGKLSPSRIADHTPFFIELLDDGDNRMVWSAMATLATLASSEGATLMKHLPSILDSADRSTVIAKDNCMRILAALLHQDRFHASVADIALERLEDAAPNQFPTYAEILASSLLMEERTELIRILKNRLSKESWPDSKKRRIQKCLRQLERR